MRKLAVENKKDGLQGMPAQLSAPKSQRFLRFVTAMPIADPRNRSDFRDKETALLHCDLRVRWKVASDLRFLAAISEPKTPFCEISGDLVPSTRKSLAIAIVRFWCAKLRRQEESRYCPESGGTFACYCCSQCH